jgi:hypothetical protein
MPDQARGDTPLGDDPKTWTWSKRIHAQIWETVRQFSRVNSVEIWIGNLLLGDWLAVETVDWDENTPGKNYKLEKAERGKPRSAFESG